MSAVSKRAIVQRDPAIDNPCRQQGDRKSRAILVQWDRYRVVDDGIQWVIQVRRGRKTAKSTGWRGIKWHIQRTDLRRSIRNLVGVDWGSHLPKNHP